MGYIENDLLDGEKIVYSGHLHWRIFVPAFFHMALAVLLLAAEEKLRLPILILLAVFFALWSAFALIAAAVTKSSTELAVTNKRVIFKTGLISRNTMEMSHHRIESIREEQSVMGRIFGYGTIIVEGTGGGQESLRNIANPLIFKKHAQAAAEQAVSGGGK
ncbi:MAG: PH domain-containing protein [Alphaproteobacteria bacterium]|nr:PH domain-containing protein [Alphaproteobacteria bacterium]MDE2335815.1 PH domain-containing protein [Alphaproteobacteria bacterium]